LHFDELSTNPFDKLKTGLSTYSSQYFEIYDETFGISLLSISSTANSNVQNQPRL
jgi:hypothetical protein